MILKYECLFGQHTWHVGRVRKSFFIHTAKFKDSRFHKMKCRPFRLNPKERIVIAKYLKNLCENDIVAPTSSARNGVNLFLVPKPSSMEEQVVIGNEGWQELKKEYENTFDQAAESDGSSPWNGSEKPSKHKSNESEKPSKQKINNISLHPTVDTCQNSYKEGNKSKNIQ